MGMTTLYGKGAIVMNDDRHTYTMMNGCIELPDHLVNRALSMGFTRHPLPSVAADLPAGDAPAALIEATEGGGLALVSGEEPASPLETARLPERPVIDASRSDDDLLMQFAIEALDAGYTESAAAHIAANRLRHLRAGGTGYCQLEEGLTLADIQKQPATQAIGIPAEHPQTSIAAEAAARAHSDPSAGSTAGDSA